MNSEEVRWLFAVAKSVFIIKLENRILVQIKRCQSAFSGKGAEVNLCHIIFTANIEKHQKI